MRDLDLIVGSGSGDRIDRYLSESRCIATRAQVQRLIKKGLVVVDGHTVRPSHKVKEGEAIRITFPDPQPSTLLAEDIPLDILYEDRHLLVVDKPAGMVVHPGSGVRTGTLVNALLGYCDDLSGIGGVTRPGIVHRLDKGTSGLLVVAKDDRTHLALSEDLKARRIKRTYEAVVWGMPEEAGRIETLIGRSHADRKRMAVRKSRGRVAVTRYGILERYGFAARLRVRLETGRTHQIRVHLAHVGHPVFGDPTYGGRRRKYGGLPGGVIAEARKCLELIDRQALHAARLSFTHPVGKRKIDLKAPMPEDMGKLIEALRGQEKEAGVED
jgi:23S rRNA pseudouridine1911/1915/1917 synthase